MLALRYLATYKKRKDLNIPAKSKDLKKCIKLLAADSESITLLHDQNVIKDLDSNKDWHLASNFENYQFGMILSNELINQIKIENKKSLRIIGIPKTLFLKKEENRLLNNSFSIKENFNETKDNPIKKNITLKKEIEKNDKTPKYTFYGSGDNKIDEAVACFRIIGDIFDLPLKADIIKRTIVKNLDKKVDSVSLQLCAFIFESIGLKTQTLELPLNLLERVDTPALIQLKDKELAVLVEIKEEKMLIARPQLEMQTLQKTQLSELTKDEDKLPILFLKTTDRTPKRKFGLKWFLPAIKKNRRPLIEVLVASLFVQIFQLMNPLLIQQIIDNVLGRGAVGSLPILAVLLFAFSIFENAYGSKN